MRTSQALLRALAGGVFCFLLALAGGCGRGQLEGEGAPGEMVFFGETSKIRGFDPVKAGDVSSALAASKVYEGLLQYSYLDRPYHIEPLLAESLPEVSRDGLTYTFKIRKGIYFQDDPCFKATGGKGRELVAEDFVYSMKRISDMKNGSSGYWAFNDRIVGLDEWREETGGEAPSDYRREIEGLRALDRYTLRIQLTRPYPQLLWILTMHYSFAVPREAVEYYGKEFVNHPVGTGPYILKSYRQNYRYEFVRNPKWAETGRIDRYPDRAAPGTDPQLLADAGKPVPFIDRIIQYVIEDSTTEWLMFLTGQLESSGVSRDNWDAVVTQEKQLSDDLSKQGIRLLSSPTLDLFYIGFNMDDPVVGRNKKLRQAMTCAFNTEEYIQFYNNRIVRPNGPIPPGVAGYSERPYALPVRPRPREKTAGRGRLPGRQGSEDRSPAPTHARTRLRGKSRVPPGRRALRQLHGEDRNRHQAELQQLADLPGKNGAAAGAVVQPRLGRGLSRRGKFPPAVLRPEQLARPEPLQLQQHRIRQAV